MKAQAQGPLRSYRGRWSMRRCGAHLERSQYMTPEQLILIDAILTLPETSLEKEYQRRTAAINAVMMYCGVEERTSYRRGRQGRPVEDDVSTVVKVEEP